jgi:hypothetical protein
MMLAPLVTELMIKAMEPEAKVMVQLAIVVKIFLARMSMNEVVRYDWVIVFGL